MTLDLNIIFVQNVLFNCKSMSFQLGCCLKTSKRPVDLQNFSDISRIGGIAKVKKRYYPYTLD